MADRKELTVITKAKKLMEYTFTITNSENRFPKKIRRNSKNNAKRRLRKLLLMRKNGKISKEKVLQSYNCWMNHAKHGNTYHLRRTLKKNLAQKSGRRKEVFLNDN